MANNEKLPIRVQHKRMTASQWLSSSLILLQGELGVETDTGKVKVGDGINRFSSLKYLTGPQGERGLQGEKGQKGDKGADGVVTFASLTQQQKDSLKGERGLQGVQGERGAPGANGTSSYVHIKYSNSSNGNPMNDNASSTYIGIYSGSSAIAPSSYSSYKWSKIKGEDGRVGANGVNGTNGVNLIMHAGDIVGGGDPGQTATFNRSNLRPSDIAKVGDIVFDHYVHSAGVQIGFWRITSLNATQCSVTGLSPGFVIPKGNNGANGAPGQNIVNQNGGQQLKYWAGTEAEYNRISNKDSNTIYDIYK